MASIFDSASRFRSAVADLSWSTSDGSSSSSSASSSTDSTDPYEALRLRFGEQLREKVCIINSSSNSDVPLNDSRSVSGDGCILQGSSQSNLVTSNGGARLASSIHWALGSSAENAPIVDALEIREISSEGSLELSGDPSSHTVVTGSGSGKIVTASQGTWELQLTARAEGTSPQEGDFDRLELSSGNMTLKVTGPEYTAILVETFSSGHTQSPDTCTLNGVAMDPQQCIELSDKIQNSVF